MMAGDYHNSARLAELVRFSQRVYNRHAFRNCIFFKTNIQT